MKPKKMLVLTALMAGSLFAGGLAVQAQDSTNAPVAASSAARPHRQNMKARIKALKLTEDQKPKVKELFAAQMKKMRALHQDSSLTSADKRAKFKALRKETNKKLKAILTSDQYAKWMKMNSRHHRPTPARAQKSAEADATN